jgi:hypothetical protein
VDGVRFAKDGPAIPVELLHALEDGGLTIFIGAGVSRQCGLPDFKGLVTSAYAKLGRTIQPDEQDLFNRGSFDATLGLIENRIGKPLLRKAIREILELKPDADLTTHEALLKLATSRSGQLRLVTTNFDLAFELSATGGGRGFDYAPYLPVPGSAWNSIVYLHGGLGNTRDAAGASLVLTSTDFGRAYITEGWASRFLAELFRQSTAVLFVGYSVSDPAIRYVVDAFAADRGDTRGHVAVAYIITASGDAQDERTWKSRGIEPIVYDPRDNHRLLHETLRNCANRYATGLFDRASIVLEYGSQSPSGVLGAPDEGAISQMTWALKDGYAARKFAKLDPPPSIAWLGVLSTAGLFTMEPSGLGPCPAVAGAPMSNLVPPLHKATEGLCQWICAHLAAPDLIRWVIENGCHLHPELAAQVRNRIADAKAPKLPNGAERIWRFLSAIAAPVYSGVVSYEVLRNYRAIDEQDWNPLLRSLVLSWLAPTIQFKKPFRSGKMEDLDTEIAGSYAGIELMPAAGDRSQDVVTKLLARTDSDIVVLELLGEFTELLRRGLSFLEYLGEASSDFDATYSGRPSIDDHLQNRHFRCWPVYVQLLRAVWERVAAIDSSRAREEVTHWARISFPLFRRFVLWSAGRPSGLSASESINYVNTQPASLLWGVDTRRELLQYLSRIGPLLSHDEAKILSGRILAGPPRVNFRAEVSDEEFQRHIDRAIHIRLAKLREGGFVLAEDVQSIWDQLLERYPNWPRTTIEKDEFVVWFGESQFSAVPDRDAYPNDYLDWTDASIVADVKADPAAPETVKRWQGLLDNDVRRAVAVLDILGGRGMFDLALWASSLDALIGEETRADCVRLYATFGPQLGPDFISKHLSALTRVINRYYHGKNREQEDSAWLLWDLLLEPASQIAPTDTAEPVINALNSPIGELTEALLIKLGNLAPNTYDDIPEPFRRRLEGLLDGVRPAHRLSRLVLARALAWLYGLNPDFVGRSLLTRFDWATSEEARHAWLGYLMSPRITPELWPVLCPLLLKVFPHSAALGDYEDQFYSFFAFLLLHADYALDTRDARNALSVATPKGRAQVAWYWWRQADSATDYGATLYRERLKFLLTNVWPIERELRDEAASENLAKLATCCSSAFPDAVETILPLLSKLREPYAVVLTFKEGDEPCLGRGRAFRPPRCVVLNRPMFWEGWRPTT